MAIADNKLSIDNPWMSGIKQDLDIGIAEAVKVVKGGNKAKLTLTMEFEECDSDERLEEKKLYPIDFGVKVTSQEEMMNAKASTPCLTIFEDKDGVTHARKADDQMNMFDEDEGK